MLQNNGERHETFISMEENGYHYSAQFERVPFSRGSCRYAFSGKMAGYGPKLKPDCVTKVFIKKDFKSKDDLTNMWIKEVRASIKANEFANIFNTIPTFPGQRIRFIIPIIAFVKSVASYFDTTTNMVNFDTKYVNFLDAVGIEEFIPGNYAKFNSNSGWEDGVTSVMHAFSHWTWHTSNHEFMVCDLQGVKCDQGFILTDPSVHSINQTFGMTDLGFVGMEKVLNNHKCNNICQLLSLPTPPKGFIVDGVQQHKMYSNELTTWQNMRNINASYFKLYGQQLLYSC